MIDVIKSATKILKDNAKGNNSIKIKIVFSKKINLLKSSTVFFSFFCILYFHFIEIILVIYLIMKKILVCGAGGFIGGHLVSHFIEKGNTKIICADIKKKKFLVSI